VTINVIGHLGRRYLFVANLAAQDSLLCTVSASVLIRLQLTPIAWETLPGLQSATMDQYLDITGHYKFLLHSTVG